MQKLILLFLILIIDHQAHPGWGLAIDSKGSVYFTDIINRTIWKVDPGNEPEAYLTNVWSHSIYIDQNDNLYFENEEFEMGNGWISLKKVDRTKKVEYIIKPTKYGDGFNSPNFAITRNGSVYYLQKDTLFKRDKAGKSKPILKEGLNNPYYCSMQKDGKIYFVDSDGIKRLSSKGIIESVATDLMINDPPDNPYPNEKRDIFNRIYGLTIDDEGNIYFAYHGNSRVYRINLSGEKAEIYFSRSNWYPLGLAWFNDTLYVLEEGHSSGTGPQAVRIQRLNKSGASEILAQIGEVEIK